jgi:nitrate reductase gamma subunit
MLLKFFFGIYPYLCLAVFLLGSLLRFDREQYTWKADSSQLLDRKGLRLANNLFHVGILALFGGHFVGLLSPHWVWELLGMSDAAHQNMAIIAGTVFGITCLIGGALLWRRRMFNPRIRAVTRRMDIFILDWLLITLMLGLATIPVSIIHSSHGDASTMMALSNWCKSVVTFSADPQLLESVHLIFKLHLVSALTLFLLFPFSRLVHIWSAPVGYLGRPYQVVRSKYVKMR